MADKYTIDEDMTFEKATETLNAIIRKLSDGNVSLDESLELYKYGTALVKFCNSKLNEVKQQIELINAQTGESSPAEF